MSTPAVFEIVEDDLLPVLVCVLQNSDGSPIDLTGVDSVTFYMSTADRSKEKISGGTCTIVDGVGGTVSYTWVTGNTDTVGKYNGQFRVTIGAKFFTVPTLEPVQIVVNQRFTQ